MLVSYFAGGKHRYQTFAWCEHLPCPIWSYCHCVSPSAPSVWVLGPVAPSNYFCDSSIFLLNVSDFFFSLSSYCFSYFDFVFRSLWFGTNSDLHQIKNVCCFEAESGCSKFSLLWGMCMAGDKNNCVWRPSDIYCNTLCEIAHLSLAGTLSTFIVTLIIKFPQISICRPLDIIICFYVVFFCF